MSKLINISPEPAVMDVAAMQNLFFLGGGNGNGQQLPNQNNGVDENLLSLRDDSQNQSLTGLNSSSLLSQLPLISQQQQAVVAAQAAAAMAERSLSNIAGGPSASSLVSQQMGGFDFGENPATSSSAAAHQLQQMGAGFMSGFGNPYDTSSVPGFMDSNRLLLQRLQAVQHGGAAPSPASWASLGGGLNPASSMAQQAAASALPSAGTPLGHDVYAESGLLGPWSSTSAGLLGKIASLETAAKKKVVRKKPKDKPKRPLSAYNIFFKEERARILASIPSSGPDSDQADDGAEDVKGGKKKKKVPHGKIGFENLAKVIGQRWQELDHEKSEYYKAKAAEDMKRYKDQMEIFLTKQAEKKRATEPHDDESGQEGDQRKRSAGAAIEIEEGGGHDEKPAASKKRKLAADASYEQSEELL